MTTVSICWVPTRGWAKHCKEQKVAPVNNAHYNRKTHIVYARMDAGKAVLHHEMGHVLDAPGEKHPQLAPNAGLKDMVKAVGPYWKHARMVGFDSRAGTWLFRWRGPRHGQDRLLKDMLEGPVDIEAWKTMNLD